jgi:hypothetical protein
MRQERDRDCCTIGSDPEMDGFAIKLWDHMPINVTGSCPDEG